jgi:hypothetical protein
MLGLKGYGARALKLLHFVSALKWGRESWELGRHGTFSCPAAQAGRRSRGRLAVMAGTSRFAHGGLGREPLIELISDPATTN